MRRHYQRGRATRSLSPELLESLQTNRSARKSALILVKQRGVARFSFCAQCKTPIHCPRCQATMTEANEGHFRCLSCGYQTGTFPSCAACGHMHFKHFGAGTQKIVRELERSGLGSRIIVIDRDTQAHKAGFTDLLVTLANLSPDHIIVATYDSAYSLPLPPLGLVALVEPDQGLFYPDFQSAERLWRELRRFGGKLMLHGMLWVQTFEPEAAHWTTWVTQPLALTAQSLLEERKSLHYPPYYQLIQLECFPTKSLSSAALADLVETYIRKLKLTEITILPKYLPFSQKNRYHILIRIPKNVPLPPALHTALHTLDAAVRITRNPLSL